MSRKIDDERGPIPMVLGDGIETYEHKQNFNLEKMCHVNNKNIQTFIDIYANVPLSMALG